MSFVGTDVVFLPVECMLLQTLVVGTMSPLFNICLGKPTLRTLCPVACLCSHRQKKPFADKHAVFLLVCLLLQKSSMAHLLNQYVLGETTLRTFFTVAKFSSPAGRKNVICTNVVFLLLVWMLLQTWAVGTMS